MTKLCLTVACEYNKGERVAQNPLQYGTQDLEHASEEEEDAAMNKLVRHEVVV